MMSAYKTATNLSRHAHVIVLAAGDPPFYEHPEKNLEIYRLKNVYLKDPINYMIPFSIFWHTIHIIQKEKPDVFLVNKFMFFNAFVIPLLKIMGKRVYTQIDAFPSIDWKSRTPWIRPIMWVYLRLIGIPLLWMSDLVILFHEGMTPIAQRFHLNFQVIHNGVNMDELESVSCASDVEKKRLADIHIGFVGRLESMKGYDILLQACQKILPSYPQVKLFMVGNTKGKEYIVTEYQSAQIHFLDVRNDVASILKGIDIFVLPSFSEGLSNSLMEAMAAGCACITMDKKGGNQILIEDGVTGLFASVGNPEDLEQKLCYLIEHPDVRKRLGINAKQRIQKQFNWNTIVHEYLRLFKKQYT